MRLPESVKIGPYRYGVEFVGDLRADDDRKLFGQCDLPNLLIRIALSLPPERTLCTFLHEVLHACDDYMQAGLTEKQTDRLSHALAAFLTDNDLLKEPA